MEFHEDIIFKNDTEEFGPELTELLEIEGEIESIHTGEYSIIQPKMYKPDIIIEFKDKIVILEFQSTKIDILDEKRFRFYTALYDQRLGRARKPIEVHVLSTVEKIEPIKYRINEDSLFTIYVHSLKKFDADKFLNMMNTKIKDNKGFTRKELLMTSLSCFMKSENSIEQNLLDSAVTITNAPNLNYELGQFVKGIILILADKFVKDKSLNKTISNLVGGNMKIVEDYAQRVAQRKVNEKLNEKNREFVINLSNEGYGIDDMARIAGVTVDFVKKTLSL